MDVLLESDAIGYCAASAARRDHLWREAEQRGTNPAWLLPIFELCRAIHFGARRARRFDVDEFRACWQDLIDSHSARRDANGCLLRLLDGGDGASDNLPRDIWSRARVADDAIDDVAPLGDPRDLLRDPRPFRDCFRMLGNVAFEEVVQEPEHIRQWEYLLPELSAQDLGSRNGATDLVLDTNFFVDLLDELPQDGRLVTLPCHTGRAANKLAGARRLFSEALRTRGDSGKLIVPAAVLVESFGIVRVKDPIQHANASAVMDAITHGGSDWPLWDAFAFPGLSFEVFDAFLGLHEEMARRVPERADWPDFTDAIILAHGLSEQCPVVSAEWTEKQDWNAVRRLFPWLFLP